ncbi:MAG: hypothetical protein NW201_04320 [Gemmatimonadales bacterium]|nr:hypothetical protein [Gemmatimonadales bacterium]
MQVGYATHAIDTLPGAVRVDELWDLDVAGVGRSGRLLLTSSATLSRRVELREAQVGVPRGRIRLDVGADSSVRGVVPRVGRPGADTTTTASGAVPTLPSTLALELMASGELRVGRSVRVALVDPVTARPAVVALRLAAESTFTIPDSVVYDSATRRWSAVRSERLPGWRLQPDGPAPPWHAWVDAQGQVIDAELPFGLRLTRTMYELAKDNYRADSAPPDRAAAAALAPFLAWIGAEPPKERR